MDDEPLDAEEVEHDLDSIEDEAPLDDAFGAASPGGSRKRGLFTSEMSTMAGDVSEVQDRGLLARLFRRRKRKPRNT